MTSYTRPGSFTTSQTQYPFIAVPHQKVASNQIEPASQKRGNYFLILLDTEPKLGAAAMPSTTNNATQIRVQCTWPGGIKVMMMMMMMMMITVIMMPRLAKLSKV